MNLLVCVCKNFYKVCSQSYHDVIVRYHRGGWSEEVNSCILFLSYMVYL
jgi:hypothetical protein